MVASEVLRLVEVKRMPVPSAGAMRGVVDLTYGFKIMGVAGCEQCHGDQRQDFEEFRERVHVRGGYGSRTSSWRSTV